MVWVKIETWGSGCPGTQSGPDPGPGGAPRPDQAAPGGALKPDQRPGGAFDRIKPADLAPGGAISL